MKINANDILSLLATRHSKDVWIPECKDGPTWGTKMVRLDGWAMKKSWSNFCTWGYEIKVSRQDFLKDTKWQAYLGLCNSFYFVCPPKIIDPSELPPEAGLIWTSANSKMLYTKKKAPHRQIDLPIELFIYILMCRTKIVPSTMYYQDKERSVDYWRNWLKDKAEKKEIGHMCSRKLSEIYREKVTKVLDDNSQLKGQIADLQGVKEFCAALGYDNLNYYTAKRIEKAVSDAVKGVPDELRWTIDGAIDHLQKLKNLLAKEAAL